MDIRLTFPKTVSALVGYQYGEEVYRKQVKDKICFEDAVVIVFPDEITSIAISFVQGFYNEIVQRLGLEQAIKFKIRAATPELERKIKDSILSII